MFRLSLRIYIIHTNTHDIIADSVEEDKHDKYWFLIQLTL